jgi:chitinase
VAWITNYGFDGIDLDWEYPVEGGEWDTGHRPQDAENYVLLLEAIRSQLDNLAAQNGACYLLTAATSCDADSVTNRFDLTNMCLHIDWFNVMTYDMAGPWDSKTGHNAGLYANPSAPHPLLNVDTSVRTYLSNGVPPEKIVLGLPFYGRGFDNTGTTDHGLFQPFSGAASESSWGEAGMFDFKDLHDGTCGHRYINHGGYTRYYDEISGVPYLYNPTSNVFISYDDEQSIALKAAYVRDQNLAGVMYWSADADTDNFLLQGAIYKTFYPFTISSTAQGPVQMAWQALTGQVYTVEHALDPPAGAWTVCSTLVDEAGSPLNIITGANVRVQAFDTNSITADFRCYRINMQTPAWP